MRVLLRPAHQYSRMSGMKTTIAATPTRSPWADLRQLLLGLVVVTSLFLAALIAMGIGWAACLALAAVEILAALAPRWDSETWIFRQITLLSSAGAAAVGVFHLIVL